MEVSGLTGCPNCPWRPYEILVFNLGETGQKNAGSYPL